MHHDEANQAVKFGALLERGEYAYDARDHHGPTLYYVTLPVAWLRGQATLAALDEWTLRGVPAAFGAATILLLPLLAAGIGRTAVAAAALLMALSPAMVFYSRMYIQESMFACFTLAFAIAIGRATTERGWQWPMLAGIAAGLATATKETAVIVLPASLAACALAWWSLGSTRFSVAPANAGWRRARDRRPRDRRGDRVALLLVVSRASGWRLRAGSRRRHVLPTRHGSGQPRAPVALLRPPPRLVIVRRPGVDRSDRARPRRRRRGDGLDPARSVEPRIGVLAPISHGHRRPHHGDLLRHSVQDALEPRPLLRCDDRRRWNRCVGAGAGDGVPCGSRLPGWRGRGRLRAPGMAGVACIGRIRVGPAQSIRLRTDGPRCRPHGRAHPRSGRPAWRAASACWSR